MRYPSILLLLAALGAAAAPAPAAFRDGMPPAVDSTDVVVDDADRARVEVTAYWVPLPAGAVEGAHGATVLSDGGTGADGVVRFRPLFDAAGTYEVSLYWPALAGRPLATNAAVTVHHAGGSASFTVDQRAQSRAWHTLGTFTFTAGRGASVEVRNDAADGVVLADAVRFKRVR